MDDNEHIAGQRVCGNSMIFVADTAQQARAAQEYRRTGSREQLRTLGDALITTFDISQLLDLIARELPELGIPSCYISLYADPAQSLETARLVLAFTSQGRVALEADGMLFHTRELAPQGVLPQDRSYVMVVEPLYFRGFQIGF